MDVDDGDIDLNMLDHYHLNQLYFRYRRMHGFCRECGVMGRKDNLVAHHLKHCQPTKPAWVSGFLPNGCLPNTNQSEFKKTMEIIKFGAVDAGKAKEPQESVKEDVTVNDGELDVHEPPGVKS